jgi:hypothetical protein
MTRLREQLLQWSVPVALACALLLAAVLGGALLLTGLVFLLLKAAMITLLFAWFRWHFPPILALCAGPTNFGGPTIATAFVLVLLLGAIGFDLTATVATLVALWLGLGLHPRLRQAVVSTLHDMLNPRTAITAGSENQPPPPVTPELSQWPVLALRPRRIRTPFSLRFASPRKLTSQRQFGWRWRRCKYQTSSPNRRRTAASSISASARSSLNWPV